MKIEFVKETKVDGDIYYTNIDGRYETGSMSLTETEGRAKYERLKQMKGKGYKPEVLESTEIDD